MNVYFLFAKRSLHPPMEFQVRCLLVFLAADQIWFIQCKGVGEKAIYSFIKRGGGDVLNSKVKSHWLTTIFGCQFRKNAWVTEKQRKALCSSHCKELSFIPWFVCLYLLHTCRGEPLLTVDLVPMDLIIPNPLDPSGAQLWLDLEGLLVAKIHRLEYPWISVCVGVSGTDPPADNKGRPVLHICNLKFLFHCAPNFLNPNLGRFYIYVYSFLS